jgi:hypothetical protein
MRKINLPFCFGRIRLLLFSVLLVFGQHAVAQSKPVALIKTAHNPFSPRFAIKPSAFLDLDNDGDPDVLKSFINDTIPVLWIDDDDDMKWNDVQGDGDNDCLMIDRNRDGQYGHELDLIIDWVDENRDGKADLQIIADNARYSDRGWSPGHFMIVVDTDGDGVFAYINWATLQLESWEHEGRSNFFQDYSGKALFLKIHTSSFNMADLRYNWENPFLFYDVDGDGLSEVAIRMGDAPQINLSEKYSVAPSRSISDVRFSFDLDNDNRPGNEFDFDMSLRLKGKGLDYSNYVHRYQRLRGLPASDSFFYDPRWRQLTELIYIDHQRAYADVLSKGAWTEAALVFDEDDDCERWERVEFYDPKDVFKIGTGNGGLDHNPQADATGDRGEWDSDFSGKGNLYISKWDGKIHLFGAEWGAWRVDLNAHYYQGWQGWRNVADSIPHDDCLIEPTQFATIRYRDTDNNGFFDEVDFDMNGDQQFEKTVSFKDLGIKDSETVIDVRGLSFAAYQQLFKKAANEQWRKAKQALQFAEKRGIQTGWYAVMKHPKSLQQQYSYGFWLPFFLYQDLYQQASGQNNKTLLQQLDKMYFSGNWGMAEEKRLKRSTSTQREKR